MEQYIHEILLSKENMKISAFYRYGAEWGRR